MLKIQDTSDQDNRADHAALDLSIESRYEKSENTHVNNTHADNTDADNNYDDAHTIRMDDTDTSNKNNEIAAPHDTATDTQLLQRIAEGNRLAAKTFIDRHLNFVLNVCRKKLQNHAKAEEAAQEVFLTVWRNAGIWEEKQAKVTSWLYRIAFNKSIDIIRREKPTVDIDDIADPIDPSDDAETLLQVSEDQLSLSVALELLNADQRRAIELVYFAELKQAEAAKQMGMSLAALESILRRARKALHTELSLSRPNLTLI
jgi:RNA polymerase sigma-70 factor, ECF subfamily